jgi:hypothetical protein
MQQQDQSLVIPVEDDVLQTEESPFCSIDPTCGCGGDPEFIAAIADAVIDGFLTPYEASRIIAGKTL